MKRLTKTDIIEWDIAQIERAISAIESTAQHTDYNREAILLALNEAKRVLELKLGIQTSLLDFF